MKSVKFVDELEKIPEDSMMLILSFLDIPSLCKLTLVSKKFILSKISEKDKFWKEHFEKFLKIYNLEKINYKFTSFKNGIIEIHKSWIQKLRNNYHPNAKQQEFYGYQAFLSIYQELKPKKEKSVIECVFFGNEKIGKTHLVAKLENFLTDYTEVSLSLFGSTNVITQEIMIENGKGKFSLLLNDTPGEDVNQSFYFSICHRSNVAIVCFSIVHSEGNNSLEYWIENIRRYNDGIPIILVGTMIDLRDDEEFKKNMHHTMKIMSFHDGIELAKRNNCVLYYEVSTVLGIGIEELKKLIVSVGSFEQNQKKCLFQ